MIAQYVALRALRESDAFPAADVGLLRGAEAVDGTRHTVPNLLIRSESWRPWRAYAVSTFGQRMQLQSQNRKLSMLNTLMFFIDRIETPIGELLLVADEAGKLRAVDWNDYEPRMLRLLERYYGKNGFTLEPASNPHGLRDAVNRYFAGDIGAIDKIPVETTGTSFQRAVWNELRKIPSGTATTMESSPNGSGVRRP